MNNADVCPAHHPVPRESLAGARRVGGALRDRWARSAPSPRSTQRSSTPRSTSPPGHRRRRYSGRFGHSYICPWRWPPGWSGGSAALRARGVRWACSSLQLALNALWSWLFFAWHRGAFAFVDIVALLALIVATLVSFASIRQLAAWLLAPYLAWVSFATLLNYSVWQRNPLAAVAASHIMCTVCWRRRRPGRPCCARRSAPRRRS